MAKVVHTCTGCVPIDASIIDTYVALVKTNEFAEAKENERIASEDDRETAEAARVAAEAQRVIAESERVAAEEIRAADHVTAVADHDTAVVDHANAVSDHETAVADHEGIDGVAERAIAAAEAAEHMVDIHQGPPGPGGVPPIIGGNGNWFEWDDDTQQFVDTGTRAEGTDGVGFASVSTPSAADGTATITLTNGDTITLDLNHDHTAYPKYVYCATQAAYDAITTKESDTLYLILESN